MRFDTGLRCLTIVSCLSNMLDKIHVSASARLYNTHDTPLLMAELLQLEPWLKRDDNGNMQLFIGNSIIIYVYLIVDYFFAIV